MGSSNREFDAIIYGASGFTGQFVVEELAVSANTESLYKNNNLKWAVAGRNKDKIASVLKEAAKQTSLDWVERIPIIQADSGDYNSILEMCKRAKVIMSAVGPYRFFGEPVVKACVEAATDYVDISGEPQFLEGMQLKYYEEAKRKGIYIVSAAGWDSIPADVGVSWTKKQHSGDLSAVEIIVDGRSPDGAKMNFGTWHSAIYGYAFAHELKPLRQQLYKDILHPPPTKSRYPLKARGILSYIDEVKGYCLPFLGSDKTVVRRSETLKYQQGKERPVWCETYFRVGSYFNGLMLLLVASVFGTLAKVSFGRLLLKTFPGFFSFGVVSKGDIPRESLLRRTFSHTIIGYGWDDKIEDIDRQHETPPTKKITTKVTGPDPGYIATSSFLVHSGMTLVFDRKELPEPGVITPGACFRDTYLLDRLAQRGIKFEVVSRH